jgi:hypothetical protein
MTPEEKASELVEKFASMPNNSNSFEYDKQCALIAVDELIAHSKNTAMVYDLSFDESSNYWQEVKQEIIKI